MAKNTKLDELKARVRALNEAISLTLAYGKEKRSEDVRALQRMRDKLLKKLHNYD